MKQFFFGNLLNILSLKKSKWLHGGSCLAT